MSGRAGEDRRRAEAFAAARPQHGMTLVELMVGMAVGLARGGWAGLVAAWVGFTLPSALALITFALLLQQGSLAGAAGALHGLKVVAVAVVSQAVWGMGKALCPDAPRRPCPGRCSPSQPTWAR